MTARKNLLFDFDGTVAHTADHWRETHTTLCKELDIEPPTQEEYARAVGRNPMELLPKAMRGRLSFMAYSHAFWEIYSHEPLDISPIAGAVDLIDFVISSGGKIGIVTNKPGDIARKEFSALIERIGASHLRNIFVIGFGDVKARRKPAPDMLLYAAEHLKDTPSSFSMIGDTEIDILAGHAAGMKTILFASQEKQETSAHRTVNNFKDLIEEYSSR